MTTNALVDWLSNHPTDSIDEYMGKVEKSMLQFAMWAGRTKSKASEVLGMKRTTFLQRLTARDVSHIPVPNDNVIAIWEILTRGKAKSAAREKILPYLLKMESSPMKDATDADRIEMLEELIKELDNTTLLLTLALDEMTKALEYCPEDIRSNIEGIMRKGANQEN